MLTWTFLTLASASFICKPASSTFQHWFREEINGASSKQDAFHNNQPSFPCDTNSSAPPATSVHQLRPQDVEIYDL